LFRVHECPCWLQVPSFRLPGAPLSTQGPRVPLVTPPANLVVPNLIVGSGIAGLSLALKLARRQPVLVIAKAGLTDSNTFWAQRGIASVLDAEDSFARHVQDTLVAGAGLCHQDVVEQVVTAGPRMIQELIELGVPFSGLEQGVAHLTREGGHSHRR